MAFQTNFERLLWHAVPFATAAALASAGMGVPALSDAALAAAFSGSQRTTATSRSLLKEATPRPLLTSSRSLLSAMDSKLAAVTAGADNPADDSVGTIEGEAISLQGPMTVEVVQGKVKTILRSGNDIRVKSGQARLDLVEGGKIIICGPAHLSVLKSGGSLTLALDTGIVRVLVDKLPSVTIYTAQIQAKPIAIGDGAEDILIGFDAPGVICVRATSGAVRLEQQLTGQNVIVPQGGDIVLNNGALQGLRNTAGQCNCDLQMAKAIPPPLEISRLATTEEIHQKEAEAKPVAKDDAELKNATRAPTSTPETPAAEKQGPIYQVYMPPLAYNANAAVQNEDFDPKLIVLVRRVRVRPTLIFQGRVEGEAVVKPVAAKQPAGTNPTAPAPSKPPENDSLVNRARAFIHRLFS